VRLRNPFSTDTRNLFLYVHWCFSCGRSDLGLEAHHIYGRTSSSAFNLAPVCLRCHSHMGHSTKEQRELLKETTKYLLSTVHYNPTADDMIFLERHEKDFIWVRENI
jgi:hypothetical protein